MKPITKKKLSLAPEIVRTLSSAELDIVQGGFITDITNSCSCKSCICITNQGK